MLKKCCCCKLELKIELFCKDKSKSDGLALTCKSCKSKQSKLFYEANKEEITKTHKKYNKDNSEKLALYHNKYRIINKKSIAEKDKLRKEPIKEQTREYSNKYYQDNKEIISEKNRVHYEKNKEARSITISLYQRTHKEQCVINAQRRKAKGKLLSHTLTFEQWENIKQDFNNRCAYCNRELPLTQEHFIPLSKNGEYTTNNIIPSCQSCNSSKCDKDFNIWYPKHKYYSKKREKIILEYLHYKNNNQQLAFV